MTLCLRFTSVASSSLTPLAGYLLDQSTRVGSDWWLAVWADENARNNGTSTRYYLTIYLAWVRRGCRWSAFVA